MTRRFLAFAASLVSLLGSGFLLALDPPLVLDPAVLMDPLSKDGVKSDLRYYGQPAKNGRIDLTATNGFFDRCFEALDKKPNDEGDKFIGASFGHLRRMSESVQGTARWHLWCAEAGQIKATFFLQVPAGETNHPWLIRVGDDAQTLKAQENDGESPQKQTLTFNIQRPGKVTFTIDCTKTPPPAETKLFYIKLEGSAVAKASLLRVRWRPAAVHTRFHAPKECPAPTMWVFETQPVSVATSYSPLTTAFGYYGASFKHGGKIPEGAGFNFSMWIAGKGATKAPPIEAMPRLIATAVPDGAFTTWGGEGTGTRPRATAYPDGADRTIQALRIETTREGLVTYFGYFYDEKAARWKLYVAGQKPELRAKLLKSPNFGTLSSTGSFCEIPGPPARERSGDVVREIKRRGWFFGSDQKWYRAVMGDLIADKTPEAKTEKLDSSAVNSKRAYYMNDFAAEGWMAMATGGIENYIVGSRDRDLPPKDAKPGPLPEYLKPEKAAQLFELPVTFGKSTAKVIAADAAIIDCEIKKTGPNSKATLYYGPVDCLTYEPRKVEKGSAVQIDMFRPERTWQMATPQQAVAVGSNTFKLAGLKSDTTYYFRLHVKHEQGQSWEYQSGSFKTK